MKKSKKVRPPASQQRSQVNTKATKVKTPRNLTPELCDRLGRDLLSACLKVAETHGLTVEGGELSDINLRHGFDIGFRVGIPTADGSLYSTEKAVFEVFAERLADGRGYKFTVENVEMYLKAAK